MDSFDHTASLPAFRTAHPYRDTSVIDKNAPRTNQAVVGLVTLVALLAGLPWLVGVIALQLAIGLTFGRRYCLPCVLYFEMIQPRLGEGPMEDSRAPRYANTIALTLTGGATVLLIAGLATVGWIVTGVVSAVALFSAASGFCVGCAIYSRVWGCETCVLPERF